MINELLYQIIEYKMKKFEFHPFSILTGRDK